MKLISTYKNLFVYYLMRIYFYILNIFFENNIIGELRSAVYSPTFKKVIGMAMIKKPYFNKDQKFEINLIDKSNKNIHTGKVCELPFV